MEIVKKPAGRLQRDVGTRGSIVAVVTNYFNVDVINHYDKLFHYHVSISFYPGGQPVKEMPLRRKILENLVRESYGSIDYAYDGNTNFFTLSWLPFQIFPDLVYDYVMDKTSEHPYDAYRSFETTTFSVEYKVVAKISLEALEKAFRGLECRNQAHALWILSTALRQNAVRLGCKLFRRYNFPEGQTSFDIGGGFHGYRGYSSSFVPTQFGQSMKTNVTVTVTLKPGSIIEFLIAHQNCRMPSWINWNKAKSTLMNLRVLISTSKAECRITGLSPLTCREQKFTPSVETGEISVYDYFVEARKVELKNSADYPCINVGKHQDRPIYIPIELCSLVPLAKYKNGQRTFRHDFLLAESRPKPQRRMELIEYVMKESQYDMDPNLKAYGLMVGRSPLVVEGRILPAPKLKSRELDFFPYYGRWSFRNKSFYSPCTISHWGVVNFSTNCPMDRLLFELKRIGESKGILFREAPVVIEEKRDNQKAPPLHRAEEIIREALSKIHGTPIFLLCLLPTKKNCSLYGPLKQGCLRNGIISQCLAPCILNDGNLTNVLMKLNSKLGGTSSCLVNEVNHLLPIVCTPTLILGIHANVMVSSIEWPFISKYRAAPCLFSKANWFEDKKRLGEVLFEFYTTSQSRKPNQIIIFRDGVNESQFHDFLNIEVGKIMKYCKEYDEGWNPRFLVLAQRDRKTVFLRSETGENVIPGTVVEKGVCHPLKLDFFICPHRVTGGTLRPTRYSVVLDDTWCHMDDLQLLIFALSHVGAGRTTSTSRVAPLLYARLAAKQLKVARVKKFHLKQQQQVVTNHMFFV